MSHHFKKIDQILTSLEITTIEREIIYKFIATILHLGNIEFDDGDLGTIVKESTKIHISVAAQLLSLPSDELEKALLFRTIEVAGSTIS